MAALQRQPHGSAAAGGAGVSVEAFEKLASNHQTLQKSLSTLAQQMHTSQGRTGVFVPAFWQHRIPHSDSCSVLTCHLLSTVGGALYAAPCSVLTCHLVSTVNELSMQQACHCPDYCSCHHAPLLAINELAQH